MHLRRAAVVLMLTLMGPLMAACRSAPAQDGSVEIRVATWNIEHLGSAGRGSRGIGKGDLGRRTDEQLAAIATFIKKVLGTDIIALQEVVLKLSATGCVCEPLEKIATELGEDWRYVAASPKDAAPNPEDARNLHTAFLWNSRKVRLRASFSLDMPDIEVGGVRAFARRPLAGYFQALKDGQGTNDFLLVNVHFERGQDNDENHLVAMVMLERALKGFLKDHGVKEPDRIILGDFNDNPFVKKDNGVPKYTDLMYRYMKWKKFTDLVTEETGFTRMDKNRDSIIDHVLVNDSAARHLVANKIRKYLPDDRSDDGFAEWRKTYSDHFPLVFRIKVKDKDDDEE